jgi:hypothetical protein
VHDVSTVTTNAFSDIPETRPVTEYHYVCGHGDTYYRYFDMGGPERKTIGQAGNIQPQGFPQEGEETQVIKTADPVSGISY